MNTMRKYLLSLACLLVATLAMAEENPLPPALPGDEGVADMLFEFPQIPASTKAASPPLAPTPSPIRAGEAAPSSHSDPQAVTQAVTDAVKKVLAAKGAGDQFLISGVRFNRVLQSFTLPADGEVALQDVVFDEKKGKFIGKVIAEGQPALLFRGQYHPMQMMPVMARRMKRGETITAADVTQKPIAAGRIRPEMYVMDSTTLVGHALKRSMASGQPIRRNDVELPIAVTEGAELKMIFRSGTMKLVDIGLAMDKGGIGDVVRVKNVKSGQIVRARIETPQEVLVNYLDKPAAEAVAQAGGAHEIVR